MAVCSRKSWNGRWNRRDSDIWGLCSWQTGHGHSSQAAWTLRVSKALQVQGGDVFVGHFLIPKAGRCALKQLRFLSCSHGSSACLRIGNGAGLQMMSSVLLSLKSLAGIPSTSYEVCVAKGAPTEQNALSGQFNRRAWDCLVWGTWWGTPAGLVRLGCNKLHRSMPRGFLEAPC